MSDESDLRVGFAVLYRWRLTPGMEATFREGWERVTVQLKQHRGALGSRLHLAEDGTWVAYAQWPSREAWTIAIPPLRVSDAWCDDNDATRRLLVLEHIGWTPQPSLDEGLHFSRASAGTPHSPSRRN